MRTYRVGGRAASITTIDTVSSVLWNPSSAVPVWVRELWWDQSSGAAPSQWYMRRATTRGTPGTTVTPDVNNDTEGLVAPPSGLELNLAAFSVQPTIDAAILHRLHVPGDIGAGIVVPLREKIPPGEGLAIVQSTTGDITAPDQTWVWEE